MIICPNFRNKEVLREFNELKSVVGEVGAYHVWSEQNGNSIDQAKNGNPSILFSMLLNHYEGDRLKAIKAKSKIYSTNFKKWFNGSTAIDSNGEPIITEFENDFVFVSDKEYNNTKELSTLDRTQIKSIDNTGSFSTVDSRTKGSQLDYNLQYYLNKSLEQKYVSDVEDLRQAYKKFFDKYDFKTNDSLQKELDKLISSIKNGIKIRLATLNRKDSKVSDEFKASLYLQISDLENRTIDRVVNIKSFIQNMYNDSIPTIDRILRVVNRNADKLSLSELLNLKQDFFDIYVPLIEDCSNTLASLEGFVDIIGKNDYNEMIRTLKDIRTLLNAGSNSVNNMLSSQAVDELTNVGLSVNSPTIENYILENGNTVKEDILSITKWLGSGDKMNDEAVRALFNIVQDAESNINRATFKKHNQLMELLQKIGSTNQKKLIELDDNGMPTGFLVRRRNYGRFNKDYKQFLIQLKSKLGILEDQDIMTVSPIVRKQFNREKNNWLSEHCERKYTKEYYELFDNLSPIASDARELIQIRIHKILDTVRDNRGFYDESKLSEENAKKLKQLYLEKKQLASMYDVHGRKKEGESFEIAKQLTELNEALSKQMKYKKNKELFEQVKAEKKASLTQAQYDKWIERNTVDEYTKEFYEDLEKVERLEITNVKDQELYEQLQQRKRNILKQFRNDKTQEIESLIPNATQLELDKIDIDLYKIRKRNKKTTTKTPGLKFSDVAKQVPSKLYYELRAQAIENGTYSTFEQNHCNRDSHGNVYPKSYLTKLEPAKDKYILKEQPSNYFSEVDENSPFVNKNYVLETEDIGEYYLPKSSIYDNSSAYSNVSNNEDMLELYNQLVSTIEESNSKLTNLTNLNKYRLPQISGSMWRYISARGYEGFKEYWKDKFTSKNDDLGLNDKSLSDDDNSIVEKEGSTMYFVPQNYVKNLEDPSTITANTVGSVIQYFKMAENFKVKSELRPKTEAILHFLRNRNLTSSRLIKGMQKVKTKAGVDTNIYKFAKNFVESNIYDIKTKSAIWDLKGFSIDIFGFHLTDVKARKIDFTKLLLGLKALGTTVNLGLNFICALTGATTVMFDYVVNAATGRYYNVNDAHNGLKAMVIDLFKNNFKLLSDYNRSKQMKLMQEFEVGSIMPKDDLNNPFLLKQIQRNWAFGVYSISDYFTKGLILNSVMYNFRYVNGEFINHEEFKEKYADDDVMLNQWNSFDSSYDLVDYINGEITVKNKKYLSAWNKRKDIIGNTARNLAQSADGQLTPLQRTMLSTNILGSLVMMHRQFMPLIIQERYTQNRQWDYSTQRYKEGLLRVPINIFSAMRRDERNISLTQKFLQNSTTDQRYALKQLVIEYAGISALTYLLNPIIKNIAEDDDKNILKQLLYFVMLRAQFEMTLAKTPLFLSDAISTLKSPIPLFSYYDTTSGLLTQLPVTAFNYLSGEDEKKISKGAYKGMYDWQKYGIKMFPFKNIWELQDIPAKRRYYETQIMGKK